MRNLHLNELLIRDFDENLQDVRKVVRRNNQIATLALNNVYFRKKNNILVKLNHFEVYDLEWLQVRNIIFMWTTTKFEWYDVTREVKQMIDLPLQFESCAWNPSQGMLALLSETGKVRLISFDFVKNAYSIFATNQIDEKVYVKNTNKDSNTSTIVWSKDGASFAIAFLKDASMVFEVYSEECELLATGDCLDVTLLPVLAWQPDGCIIAALQKNEGEYAIRMFENNGLKKDILPLSHTDGQVKKVHFEWNNTGDVLAVHCTMESLSILSLYTCRNCKWDLKQQLKFDVDIQLISFSWIACQQSHIALQVITDSNELQYLFNWAVDGCDKVGTLAVIDGRHLRLTYLGNELRPPPSSTITHVYPAVINIINFSPDGQYKVVVLCDNTAYVSDCTGHELFRISLSEIVQCSEVPLSINNILIDDQMNVYFVKSSGVSSWVYQVAKPVDNILNIVEHVSAICTLDNRITHISLWNELLFIRTDKNVLIYNFKLKTCIDTNWCVPAGQISTLHINNTSYVLSLSESSFYVNGHLIRNNISSYMILHNYIMITTSEEKLFCYELNSRDLGKLQSNMKDNVFTRAIPKGAILVSGIPNSTSIVLQLERGDLEVIKPRILSVRLVQTLLIEKQFAQAFLAVKHERLNTNILFDINPDLFLNNIQEFVRSYTHSDNLNIFITGLQDDDIVSKLYKNCIPVDEILTRSTIPNKKNVILKKLIETMLSVDHRLYLQSIIIANIMLNSHEGMENAVKEIKWGLSQQETEPKKSFSMDDIFHRIVPLTSAEDLLQAALSVQDFKLIQWIANKTQLDPLEYIPFFKELSKMEPHYKSYKINNYLKRYDVAFENLIKCDEVENEIVQLIEKADLYKLAVLKTARTNQWFPVVIKRCASHLISKQKLTEAGILLRQIEKYSEALDCFILDANYIEFMKLIDIITSKKIHWNSRECYQRLIKRLEETGKTREAATVYDILNRYEEGISLLIYSKDWSEAFKYILKYDRRDFIVTDFYPAIMEYSKELCGLFHQKGILFTEHKKRLEALRLEKINLLMLKHVQQQESDYLPADFQEPDTVRNADLSSLLSVLSVSTHQTGFTNTSSSTTRRKKKLARKTQETREGSMYENIALIRQLHVIASEVYGYATVVRTTCLNLMELDARALEVAAELHALYANIVANIECDVRDIWPEDFINPPKPVNITSAVMQLNIEHLESQFRYPPKPLSSDWKIYILT